jgi:hypothetical protein
LDQTVAALLRVSSFLLDVWLLVLLLVWLLLELSSLLLAMPALVACCQGEAFLF